MGQLRWGALPGKGREAGKRRTDPISFQWQQTAGPAWQPSNFFFLCEFQQILWSYTSKQAKDWTWLCRGSPEPACICKLYLLKGVFCNAWGLTLCLISLLPWNVDESDVVLNFTSFFNKMDLCYWVVFLKWIWNMSVLGRGFLLSNSAVTKMLLLLLYI